MNCMLRGRDVSFRFGCLYRNGIKLPKDASLESMEIRDLPGSGSWVEGERWMEEENRREPNRWEATVTILSFSGKLPYIFRGNLRNGPELWLNCDVGPDLRIHYILVLELDKMWVKRWSFVTNSVKFLPAFGERIDIWLQVVRRRRARGLAVEAIRL